MRNTKQKELILKIINLSNTHPTAYDIYNKCKEEIPNISLGTVYRNLNSLVELNKAIIVRIDDVNHYDKVLPHSHFLCTKCGRIFDIFDTSYDQIKVIDGNLVSDCMISFKGICKYCRKGE